MRQETQFAEGTMGRWAMTALVVASVLGTAGCSSVPDSLNPVQWYHGASDTVGGWFGGDEPEASTAAGDPGTSPKSDYPNLASVPARPTPMTTAEERETLKQGLVADRTNARYTEPAPGQAAASQPAPGHPAPAASAPSAAKAPPPPAASSQTAAVPPEPVAAAPAAAAPAAAAVASGSDNPSAALASTSPDRSALWPNRPVPETPGLKPSTTGRVGHSTVEKHDDLMTTLPTRETPGTTHATPTAAAPDTTKRTTLDSAGSAPVSKPAPAASQPAASSQSVIVNEDAIGGPSAAASFTGQSYLAGTIYFGHGSAGLSGEDLAEIRRIAKTAISSGAGVQVIGHASSRTAELNPREHELVNFNISMKRAKAIGDALIRAGVPADHVRTEAVGDSQPEFYEVMPSGEAGNRRAEIVLVY